MVRQELFSKAHDRGSPDKGTKNRPLTLTEPKELKKPH